MEMVPVHVYVWGGFSIPRLAALGERGRHWGFLLVLPPHRDGG